MRRFRPVSAVVFVLVVGLAWFGLAALGDRGAGKKQSRADDEQAGKQYASSQGVARSPNLIFYFCYQQ